MKKLLLNPEDLKVETFEAAPRKEKERGTVHAHGGSTFDQFFCDCTRGVNGSCDVSCGGTCFGEYDTCGGPCLTAPYCPSSPGYAGCG
jgi:hypothetical protein